MTNTSYGNVRMRRAQKKPTSTQLRSMAMNELQTDGVVNPTNKQVKQQIRWIKQRQNRG